MKNEFKGTKGKWEACFNWSNKNVEIGTDINEKIALVNKNYEEEYKANALLISKAPEMLEQLIKIKDLFYQRQMPNEHEINMFSVSISKLIYEATEL